MKKVLIIAYLFPPRPEIGGQRPYGLAKYFPSYGWEPTVLTAEHKGTPPDHINIIKTAYHDVTSNIKSKFGFHSDKGVHDQLGLAVLKKHNYLTWKSKIIKLIKDIILFPDDKKGWNRYAYKAACHLIESQEIDAIISTSPPITSHLIARKLKEKYDIKWIADFRDPWTQRYINNKNSLLKYLDRRLEIKTISYADALVSVTQPYVDKIKHLHRDKDISCISNGYIESGRDDKKAPPLTNKFTITYTGYLYSGKRDPEILFQSVSQLIKEQKINKDRIEIRFYCHKEEWLINEINKYNLEEFVKLNGIIPKEKVEHIQKESQLLLLIRWDSKIEIGDCPAKIYEYFNARRPIIAIGGFGGIINDILEETNAGKFADNAEMLTKYLLEYYREFDQSGQIKCKSNDNVKNYAYKRIARKYSDLLDNVCNKV